MPYIAADGGATGLRWGAAAVLVDAHCRDLRRSVTRCGVAPPGTSNTSAAAEVHSWACAVQLLRGLGQTCELVGDHTAPLITMFDARRPALSRAFAAAMSLLTMRLLQLGNTEVRLLHRKAPDSVKRDL